MSVVLITGQMRSGTSAVAGMLHAMGVPAARTLLAPIPPTYRLDWEDFDLTSYLAPLAMGRSIRDPDGWLASHFHDRRVHTKQQYGTADFCVKCPQLALIWEQVLYAAAPYRPVVIVTSRERAGVEASIDLNCFPPVRGIMRNANERIRAVLPRIKHNLMVPYEALVSDPRHYAGQIAALLGIADEARISAAAGSIKEPTSCQPC